MEPTGSLTDLISTLAPAFQARSMSRHDSLSSMSTSTTSPTVEMSTTPISRRMSNVLDSPISPTIVASSCAYCQKPTLDICVGCADTPGFENTFYCSLSCSEADWHLHRKTCKRFNTRRTMFRVGETLQEIFYMYREKLFDMSIIKIERMEYLIYERVALHGGAYNNSSKNLHSLHRFPSELCQSEEDKKAILVYLASGHSIAWLYELTCYFLGGIAFAVAEQSVTPVHRRSVVTVTSTGKTLPLNYEHYILVVTLMNGGGTYALDLCGAAYGFTSPVLRFIEYHKTRGQANFPPQYWGSPQSIRTHLLDHLNKRSRYGNLLCINAEISAKLVAATLKWEKDYGTKVDRMLQLPSEVFKLRQADLVHFLSYMIQGYLDDMAKEDEDSASDTSTPFKLNPRAASF